MNTGMTHDEFRRHLGRCVDRALAVFAAASDVGPAVGVILGNLPIVLESFGARAVRPAIEGSVDEA